MLTGTPAPIVNSALNWNITRYKSGVVVLIQGFYYPWDKMACVGGAEKFVGRIKSANWGCKKKGNLNKVQGGAGLPIEEESRRKAT